MAISISDGLPSTILDTLRKIIEDADAFNPDFENIDFGDWASIKVYIPEPNINSAMTPPFMEAFLTLQKQVYQLAALVEYGVADVGQLNENDRRDLQINVTVTGGSSNYDASLQKQLLSLLRSMVRKMSGKQAAIVVVCVAALAGGAWSWSAWLDHTKEVKVEELKSKDHLAALQSLNFASAEQSKQFHEVMDILKGQGEVGKRAVEALEQTNQALLKAATSNNKSSINGVEITRVEAELLRTPVRKRIEPTIVLRTMQVVAINTSDMSELQVVLMEPDTKNQHRIKFKDDIFAGAERHKLFEALENRKAIWVELAVKDVDGEMRVVQILRTRDSPIQAMDDEGSDP